MVPADLEAELAAWIPDANLAMACCVREDLINGDVADEGAEEESLSLSPLCGKVWLRAEAVGNPAPFEVSPLTDARNGNAVAALKAPALPGICVW